MSFQFSSLVHCLLSSFQVLAQVAELQREMDLAGGVTGSGGHAAPVLRTLNQDVDLQHLPMTTVQQLHNSIQHDLEYIEQVCENLRAN